MTAPQSATSSVNGWSGRVTKVLVIALVLYLAFLSSQLVWVFIEEPQSAIPSSFSSSSSTGVGTKKINRDIARYHLFGTASKQPSQVAEKPKQAPKTRLRLILKGVFTGEEGATSGAIIEQIGKSTDYYRVGDTLPGNAKLAEVYPDRVLLERAGGYETLYFAESSKDAPIARVVPQKREPVENIQTPEQFLEEATARLSEDPERALSSVGLSVSEDGGYVFKGNNPMLSGLNLQKGDVIRSVNGHTLGDIEQDKEMMRTLYEKGSIEVEVVRDGASFFVNYPLR